MPRISNRDITKYLLYWYLKDILPLAYVYIIAEIHKAAFDEFEGENSTNYHRSPVWHHPEGIALIDIIEKSNTFGIEQQKGIHLFMLKDVIY